MFPSRNIDPWGSFSGHFGRHLVFFDAIQVKHCVSSCISGHIGTFCISAVMWDFEFGNKIKKIVTPNVSSKRIVMFPLRNIVPWGPFGGHFGINAISFELNITGSHVILRLYRICACQIG